MPDGKRNPSRLPEGRSRKPAGDKRETGKGERRCERRDEQRQEWPRNATQAGRGEPGPVRPRRDRRERSRRRRPRRRITGRAPARATSARPHPVGRRPRRLGGEHCRRGDDRRRRQARVMAGCSRRKRRARGRRRRLGPVDPCHSRVTRTQRVGSGRNSGRRDGGRDQDAGHHGGRRDGRGWRDLREVGRGWAGGRRRPSCERGERRGCADRLHHGRSRCRASPRRNGVDLREGTVDRGRQVGHAGRRARRPGDSRRHQCTAGDCHQSPYAN